MIIVKNIETWGWKHAVRGMRNPLNSWHKSDSVLSDLGNHIGEKDLDLMKRLYKAGTEHRKYLRQVFVSMDITAPLYWWKEFDTYKIGTTANSTSTMHTLVKDDLSLMDFSTDQLSDYNFEELQNIIDTINAEINDYNETHDKTHWWQAVLLLPSCFNQKRTVTMNYENVFTMLKQREGHKLDEWNVFCEQLKALPYVKEIGGF